MAAYEESKHLANGSEITNRDETLSYMRLMILSLHHSDQTPTQEGARP